MMKINSMNEAQMLPQNGLILSKKNELYAIKRRKTINFFSFFHVFCFFLLSLPHYYNRSEPIANKMDKDINRIKVVLADKKRTNKWLAEQLGKDPATVSKWCTNSCQPTLETLMKIAKLLDVEITELVRLK